ncbi:hypothetical protein SAMN05428982_1134 [Pseudoxanthomonas sp. CF385]|uniref:hypothetical protein n=1 Tax=Pseudoxanthomonas sp. CF385 TaxID=1881042 RepID=UPI00088D70A6|nr:hypothetical protein [Pseudoxanthomonas sp. CF385]SDQ44373.1 hypothetical protein SAMN05428982_1134 [Pseudoxanthomonas sp. CF385]
MNIKRHRVVSNQSPFQGSANRLRDHAVQCAENEGWPIPCDPPEPLLAVAHAGFAQRVSSLWGEHVRDDVHSWPLHFDLRKRVVRIRDGVVHAART